VVAALKEESASILVAARRREQAAGLCRDLQVNSSPLGLDSLGGIAKTAHLLVNATPVGLDGTGLPLDPSFLHPGQVVFDLIYNPPLTPLVRAGAERGLRCHNGLGMLLHQGAAAFEIWTGRAAPHPVMRAALA
jgi:shikimate dehydrogenase